MFQYNAMPLHTNIVIQYIRPTVPLHTSVIIQYNVLRCELSDVMQELPHYDSTIVTSFLCAATTQ